MDVEGVKSRTESCNMFMNKAEDTMYCGMVLSSVHSAQALDSSSSLTFVQFCPGPLFLVFEMVGINWEWFKI